MPCDRLHPTGPRVSLRRLASFGIHASPPRLLWASPSHATPDDESDPTTTAANPAEQRAKAAATEASATRGPRASGTLPRRRIFPSAASAGRGSSVRFLTGRKSPELPSRRGAFRSFPPPLYAPRRPWPPLFGFRVRSLLLLFFLRPLSLHPLLCKSFQKRGGGAPNALISARWALLPPLLHGARPPAQHRAGGDGQVRARGCCRFFVTFKLPLPPLFSSLENLLGR